MRGWSENLERKMYLFMLIMLSTPNDNRDVLGIWIITVALVNHHADIDVASIAFGPWIFCSVWIVDCQSSSGASPCNVLSILNISILLPGCIMRTIDSCGRLIEKVCSNRKSSLNLI